MKNANKPINPCNVQRVGNEIFRPIRDTDPKEHNVSFLGLTKREYFAGLALQGLAIDPSLNTQTTAKWAIELADEFLLQLDKKTPTTET